MNPRILIVEDDISDATELEMLLDKNGYTNITIAKDVNDSIENLKTQKYHLILLDIFLGDGPLGTSLLDRIKKLKIPFIVCTGLRDKTFFDSIAEYHPEAYLIKPIEELTLINALNKFFGSYNLPSQKSIIIKQDKKLIKLDFNEIIAIKSEGNYCKFLTQGKNHLSRAKISEIDEKLPENIFLKVHRNAIINISKIESIDFSERIIRCRGEIEVKFAKKHKDKIKVAFSRHLS